MTSTNSKIIVACIIVRMKSYRLPKKALLDINGFPMTQQIIRRLQQTDAISKIVICTSDNPEDSILLKKAQEWGVDSYAGDELDVLSRLINVAEKYDADMVLRITGDNPFTDAVNIDKLINRHIETSADYTRTNRLPLGVTAEVIDRKMLRKLHDIMPDPNQSEYMSFYSFNPDIFHCEVLEPLPEQDRPYYSLTIDYPEDLELARALYENISSENGIPSLTDVIAYLDDDSDYAGVEPDTLIKLPEGKEMKYKELILMLDELAEKSRYPNNR